MIKKARELYEPRQLTLDEIADILNQQGFTNSKGDKLTKVQVHRMLTGWGRYKRLPRELIATEQELASAPLASALLQLKKKTDKRLNRERFGQRYFARSTATPGPAKEASGRAEKRLDELDKAS